MTIMKETYWVDRAKVISIFAVVVLHVSAQIAEKVENFGTSSWWVGNLFDGGVRWSVPIFIMVSGYLLLDPSKQEDFRTFYKKRAGKVLIPTIFWTLFYIIWSFVIKKYPLDLKSGKIILIKLIEGEPYYHLWFAYMIIGLYLFTPFLRKLLGAISDNEAIFLCIILFLFGD